MCGIAGRYNRDGAPIEQSTILAMTRAVAHRGPDDEGIWVRDNIGFGHRRLAIRDLSLAGHQPLMDSEGRVVITYNGEIYNDAELRRELARDFGVEFRSSCDSETIPYAYLAWGEAAFARLEGMFALALWDCRKKRLFLVRDAAGIKPLFFSDDGRTVRFGSEIKALLADADQPRRLSAERLHAYFGQGYAGPTSTTLAGIDQVPPGTIIAFEAGKARQETRYWRPQRTAELRRLGDAVDEFLPLWRRTVGEMLVSDVPVGIFQSGGIDSSLVSLTVAAERRIPLFTAVFAEETHSERDQAAFLAQKIGAEHHLLAVDTNEIDPAMTLRKVAHHFDGQVADASAFALYLIARLARSHVKVALSGDGADEFFGGYETYRASRLAHFLGPAVPPAAAGWVSRMAARLAAGDESRLPAAAVVSRFAAGLAAGGEIAHAHWRRLVPSHHVDSLYGEALRPLAKASPMREYEETIVNETGDHLDRCLLADQNFHLPAGLLAKTDAMTMAHGLEVRVPFLDRRIMDFAGRCSAELLTPFRGPDKRLLRAALERCGAPPAITRGRKKGFLVPIAGMMRRELAPLIDDTFARNELLEPYLDGSAVRALWNEHRSGARNHAYALWPIVVWALWRGEARVTAGS